MVSPTCFGIKLPLAGSVPSAFWEMLNWRAVDRILWMGVLCLVTWFKHIFNGILIFKGLIARLLYKSFGVKGLTLSLLISYIYLELLVKPEILMSYIYGLTFGNAESRLYCLQNVSTLNQCRKVFCVKVVCKHFASYQGYLNYKWDLIG
jgi:hypothetical protein